MDAEFFRAWIAEIAAVAAAQRDHLTQLDSAIGDADHGTNLARGFGVCGSLARHAFSSIVGTDLNTRSASPASPRLLRSSSVRSPRNGTLSARRDLVSFARSLMKGVGASR